MKQINFNIPKIKEIINFFSSILKLRVVVFDRNYKVVVESNVCDCSYCRAIHQNPLLSRECIVSDKEAFNKSLTTKSLYSYKCHAGLNEAVINLHIDNEVVGFLMLGQFSEIQDESARIKELFHYLDDVTFKKEEKEKFISEIPTINNDDIKMISSLLVSLSEYIIKESIIKKSQNKFIEELDAIIEKNIQSTVIKSDFIAHELGISRTSLYNLSKKYLDTTLGERILNHRLKFAERLLHNNDFSINEVAEKCGFSDYKYFIKLFKRKYGLTPGQYRRNIS